MIHSCLTGHVPFDAYKNTPRNAECFVFCYHVLMRTRPAFTLIEVVIVASIIGLLATIGMFNLMNARIEGQIHAALTHQQNLIQAAVLYHEDIGFWPPDV